MPGAGGWPSRRYGTHALLPIHVGGRDRLDLWPGSTRILRRTVAISGFRRCPWGIEGVPMSDDVSDLVFRELDPAVPVSRPLAAGWAPWWPDEPENPAPVAPAPRVIPAADTGDRRARSGR